MMLHAHFLTLKVTDYIITCTIYLSGTMVDIHVHCSGCNSRGIVSFKRFQSYLFLLDEARIFDSYNEYFGPTYFVNLAIVAEW